MARPAAWRDMPAVQRAMGETPLTAPSAAFARDLAGRRVPDLMLAPLGHDVTADGPAGLVSGIAVPLVQHAPSGADRAPTVALPAPAAARRGRPTAQRAVASVATLPPSDVGSGAEESSPLEGSAGDDLASLAATETPADIPGLAPRTLPVARLASATPALSATRVADATAPATVLALARTVASGASSGTPAPPSADASVSGLPDGAGTGSTGARVQRSASVDVTGPASGSVPGIVAATPPVPVESDGPFSPVVARRTLGESRRLGLGAPLTGRPPLAAPETGRLALPVARLARPTEAPGSTSALGSTSGRLPIETAVPAAAATSAPLPRLVVARRSTAATGPVTVLPYDSPVAPGAANPGSVDVGAEASAEADGEPTGSGAASSTRSLVGETAIAVSHLAHAEAATDGDVDGATEPGLTTLGPARTAGTVPAAAGPIAGPESGLTSAFAIDGAATGDGGATRDRVASAGLAAVQRSHAMAGRGDPARAPGALQATRTSPALAPLVAGRAMRASQPAAIATLGYRPSMEPAPVVARLAIPSLGAGDGGTDPSPAGFGGAGGSPAPSHAVAALGRDDRPVVSRAALAAGRGAAPAASSGLPLARSAAETAEPDAVETGRSGGVGSWTAGAGFTSVAALPTPFVQRAVTIDEVSVTPGTGPAGSGSAAGSAGQPGATGAGGPGTDYEELAEHVYDTIRARLTTELLLDRERAGMLVDV